MIHFKKMIKKAKAEKTESSPEKMKVQFKRKVRYDKQYLRI